MRSPQFEPAHLVAVGMTAAGLFLAELAISEKITWHVLSVGILGLVALTAAATFLAHWFKREELPRTRRRRFTTEHR